MYKKIIIASALNQGFGDRAIEVANKLIADDGQIITVHVIESVNNVVQSFMTDDIKDKTHEKIKETLTERSNENETEFTILNGNAGRQISKYAKKIGADCIIIGSHKPGLEDYFLGSTSARVVRHSNCAVHVLR